MHTGYHERKSQQMAAAPQELYIENYDKQSLLPAASFFFFLLFFIA